MRAWILPAIGLFVLAGCGTSPAAPAAESPTANTTTPLPSATASGAALDETPASDVDEPSSGPELTSVAKIAAYLERAGTDPAVEEPCGQSGNPVVSAVRVTYEDALLIGETLTNDDRWPGVRGSENRFLVSLQREDPKAIASVCTLAVDSSGIPPFDRDVIVWYSNGTFGEIGMYAATDAS